MCSDGEEESYCSCSDCAGNYSESFPSTTSSTGPKPKTLTDMPDEVISLIVQELQDAEWIDTHELPRRGAKSPKLEGEELEEGEAASCEISRQLVRDHPKWDRLVAFEKLMSSKGPDDENDDDSSDSGDSDDVAHWPIFDDVFNLSCVCQHLRDVITRLGYGLHLRLSFDKRECVSCMSVVEEEQRRVRKITLIFDDKFTLDTATIPLHDFLDCFPGLHTVVIVWNNTWERNDPRWKEMICRPEGHAPLSNITQLEIVLHSQHQSEGHSAFDDWQLQFLLSRLDFPQLEDLSITHAGFWSVDDGETERRKSYERYYGNLAGICGRWPQLESLTVHPIVIFDENHSQIYEDTWSTQLRAFLHSGINPRARNTLCISYEGVYRTEFGKARRDAFFKLFSDESPQTPEDFAKGFLSDSTENCPQVSAAPKIPDFDLEVRTLTAWEESGDQDEWTPILRIQYRDQDSLYPTVREGTRHFTPGGTFTFTLDVPPSGGNSTRRSDKGLYRRRSDGDERCEWGTRIKGLGQ